MRDPGPGCLAAATLPFLFEPSFSIYGGNLLSTLAGEFSFSLSLSISLLFLGVVAAGLRTGRHRALAAALFAATLLCHLIPAMFAVAGAVVWLVLDADLTRLVSGGVRAAVAGRRWLRRLAWSAVAGLLGVGLTAWWLLPFYAEQAYTTNMGYTKVFGYPHLLFPGSARWVLAADLVGLVAMVVRKSRVALFLVVMGGLSAMAMIVDPASKLYNVRFLPLWFLCLYLLAGYRAGRGGRARRPVVASAPARPSGSARCGPGSAPWTRGPGPRACRVTRFRRPVPVAVAAGAVVGPLVALAAVCLAVVPPLALKPSTLQKIGITVGPNQPSAWAAWNYSGYEQKPDYPEFHAVMQMMSSVGAAHGCGRAMWEYDPSLNRFGTTESLMLLPYFTNGCIDSMEGLLFESASTTPFHFINQNELSPNPSNAVVGPSRTAGLDVALGIRHLQQMGVQYLLTSSTTVQQAVAADPNATLVGSTGPWSTRYNGDSLDTTWKVYRIADSSLVVPLAAPAGGVEGRRTGPVQLARRPRSTGTTTRHGGASCRRPTARPPGPGCRWGPPRCPPSTSRPPRCPTCASRTRGSRFHVDRVGTPVEVRISYFPNWQASGPQGPGGSAPNLMVVVPTSHDVTLTYGSVPADYVGQLDHRRVPGGRHRPGGGPGPSGRSAGGPAGRPVATR